MSGKYHQTGIMGGSLNLLDVSACFVSICRGCLGQIELSDPVSWKFVVEKKNWQFLGVYLLIWLQVITTPSELNILKCTLMRLFHILVQLYIECLLFCRLSVQTSENLLLTIILGLWVSFNLSNIFYFLDK